MAGDKHETLAEVTARAGLPGGVEDRCYQPGQRGHTEHQLRTLVEGVPHLIWRSCGSGKWTWSSPQWMAYTGQTQEGSHGRGWLDVVHPGDCKRVILAWDAVLPHGELDVEFRVRRASDDVWVWHRTTSLPLRDEAGRIIEWLGSTTEIQAYKELQEQQRELLAAAERHAEELTAEVARRQEAEVQLRQTVFHDGLTGLCNRAGITDRLRRMLADRDSPGPGCALLFLNLDRFGEVNDSLGHQAGDRLLVEVAQRLEGCLHGQGTLARLGGDEFAVLVEGVSDTRSAVALARRIAETMQGSMWLGPQEVFCTCSIGVAHAMLRQLRPEQLMRDADVAMRRAKRHGPGSHAVFTEVMRDGVAGALALQTDLRNAVTRGELVLQYQPICDAATAGIVGVEALVRWRHPERGVVLPASFIPAAERTGLIRDLGRWVLREACAQVMAWHDRFPGLELQLNVNTSGRELRDRRFMVEVQEALAETGFEPRLLQLEVTEGVFLEQSEASGEMLNGLRALGLRIALDDFGTGYSSLGYLSRYPVDTLKIDRSFVAEMLHEPRAWTTVETIVTLGRTMNLAVVAEGVEEDAQLQALRAVGCGLVQGYLLGRPLPVEEIETALAGSGGLGFRGAVLQGSG